VAALEMNDLDPGALVQLDVHGYLMDGTPFVASDCVRLVPPDSPPANVFFTSNVADAYLEVAPLDLRLDSAGFTNFDRVFPIGTVMTITAPTQLMGSAFIGWRINGVMKATDQMTIRVTLNGETNIRAVYGRALSPLPAQMTAIGGADPGS
jgi:hypothetical protein